MPSQSLPTKDPLDVIDHVIDWSKYLGTEDTISVPPTLTVTPAGELTVRDVYLEGNLVRFWCEGGVAGVTYKLSCTITTTGGRTISRTVQLNVADL